jgi:two-component system OmpR family sensor kinase
MDGSKRSVTVSLQGRLSLWLLLAICVIAAAAAVLAFFSALDEAHDRQDQQLLQTADLIGRIDALSNPGSPVTGSSGISNIDLGQRVVLRILADDEGPRPMAEQRAPAFSHELGDGIQTVQVGGDRWRVLVASKTNGLRLAVAQQTATRDALARAQAWRTLLPFLLLVPLLLLMVAVLVQQMFKPVKTLASELRRRHVNDLGHLAHGELPSELLPFVAAINQLLLRVSRSMAQQRRFVADAAHELRSPLTAMSLQAEWLSGSALPDEAGKRLVALRDGLARSRMLLDQLLNMARAQESGLESSEKTSLQKIIREVLEDLVPLAQEKQIDIGVVGDGDALIAAHPVDLTVLVKNLVDNAIRYTPEGGSVDIRVGNHGGAAVLEVSDTGPGIAPAERERVFDPFYRVLGNGQLGSGLGLAIVHAIAGSIDAKISLHERAADASGLLVRVVFHTARKDP